MKPGELEAEADIAIFVKAGKIREAGHRLVEFELSLDENRRSGLNFDWTNNSLVEAHIIGKAERIFNSRPAFFGPLSDDEWRILQNFAVLRFFNLHAIHFKGVAAPRHRGLKPDVCARMLAFSVNEQSRFDGARENGAAWVDVYAGQGSCDYCTSLSGIYRIDDAPMPPHIDCTHEMGCRCLSMYLLPGMINEKRLARLRFNFDESDERLNNESPLHHINKNIAQPKPNTDDARGPVSRNFLKRLIFR